MRKRKLKIIVKMTKRDSFKDNNYNNNNINFYLRILMKSISMRCTIQMSTQNKNKKHTCNIILNLKSIIHVIDKKTGA